ncbi:response regulator transcription factor [uncultured Brevibacillus sp.]|uniref:response regulator transcription factor n=1 Tax=uncultured Brevibacillus sp. TaxID=169970 RepID=UPI002592BEF3|nr:response regulator transcription factor [uncultured Brevibacillus sp.]
METPMILLVEDDEMIRELVRLYLKANHFGVWETENIREAITTLQQKQPALIVLDILLPDGSGLELCQSLRESGSEIPVLFLTCKDDSEDMIAGLDLGGDDYMTKPFDPNILVSRIKAILRRRGVQEKKDSAKSTREELIERLTKREIEMLTLIKAGYTNQEIALHYQISIGTVKGYNNQLFGKLGAKNRTHAIMLASEIGLLRGS